MNNISIVFHSAATVRFNDPLKVTIETNMIGTRKIINLCDRMKNLKVCNLICKLSL